MNYMVIKDKYIEDMCREVTKYTVHVIDGVSGKMGKGGAGIIIGDDGYIATTYSSVGDLEFTKPIITLNSGEELIGKVVAKDIKKNCAIIKVNRSFSKNDIAILSKENELKIGSRIFSCGYGRRLKGSNITLGIISNNKVRINNLKLKYNIERNGYTSIEEDTLIIKNAILASNINDGVVFNIRGEVIGISGEISSSYDKDKIVDSTSVVIPISNFKKLFEDYLLSIVQYGNPYYYM